MSVVSVSSQETGTADGGPYLASAALDGNTATYWYTRYQTVVDPPPHTLILDLGASYTVNGWKYLPWQGTDATGRITQYEFYVSTDGSTWGTKLTDPLLTGTLSKAAVGGGATFTNLSIATPGTGYQFTASAPGLTPALSAPFTISSGRQLSAPSNLRVISR
jgi:F5/8 type C domain